jgi:hypothetical protein
LDNTKASVAKIRDGSTRVLAAAFIAIVSVVIYTFAGAAVTAFAGWATRAGEFRAIFGRRNLWLRRGRRSNHHLPPTRTSARFSRFEEKPSLPSCFFGTRHREDHRIKSRN